MPLAAVFDTNTYQRLPSRLLDTLLVAERDQDVVPCADNWVMVELIAKLVDPDQRAHARAALKKQWYHCGGDALRMVVDCEEQVCRILFGRSPADHLPVRERLGGIAAVIAKRAPGEEIDDLLGAAGELRAHVDAVEQDRVDTVLNGIVRTLIPGAVSWNAIAKDSKLQAEVLRWIDAGEAVRALAASEVRRAHEELKVPVPDPLPHDMIDAVLRHFRYPLEVESTVIRHVVERGWDLTLNGRRNAIWDAQIAFNAGQSISGGRRIMLVTDDALFHDVARRVGEAHVQTLGAYLKARGIDTSDLGVPRG